MVIISIMSLYSNSLFNVPMEKQYTLRCNNTLILIYPLHQQIYVIKNKIANEESDEEGVTITKKMAKNLIKPDNGKTMRKGTKFISMNCFRI